jgi:peptide-methionine (S)-S-oxide reductase
LHPDSAYIAINDMPKVANLKRLFPNLYRDKPVLVEAAQ